MRELTAMASRGDDRFGLSWRADLAAGIFANLDTIDVVEVIADDLFDAPARTRRAVATLGREVPVTLHGVGLGLASCAPADERRLSAMAHAVERIRPESWSEHLAFVRGGGVEIGHLAVPPRNAASVEGAARNLARARAVVGTTPLVENVATLVEPPGSDRSEGAFVADVLAASDADLLLDLHNLHSNGLNFGYDPLRVLDLIPLERVRSVHIAGGGWLRSPAHGGERRWLDDHRHDVGGPVYALLAVLARRSTRPLTVILERDGAYPPMEWLLRELGLARDAVGAGRAARAATGTA
jgi:uncharacterized protein (UPF0276 family)